MQQHVGVRSLEMQASMHRLWRAVVLVPLLLLAACDNHEAGTARISAKGPSTLSFTPPLALQASRTIDLDLLELAVRVDGRSVSVPRVSEDRWEGSTTVPTNRFVTVQVVWSLQDLVVAQAIRELPVPLAELAGGNPTIEFDSDEFDTTDDFDSDGLSNLREFDDETDPRSAADPGTALSDMALDLSFRLPNDLQAASQAITDPVQINASINDRIVTLTRNDNVWRGRTTVLEGSDVFITANVFATTDREDELARLQKGARVEPGVALEFDGGDYRTAFDADLNGQTNLEELLSGTEALPAEPTPAEPLTDDPAPVDTETPAPVETVDPVVPAEPVDPIEPTTPVVPTIPSGNGCEISQFDPACLLDTDGDGTPDSVETEAADTDNDAIPDFQESSIVDADNDGFAAELDVNESDPCSPDVAADACVEQFLDTDGDGLLDIEEGTVDTDGDGMLDRDESFIDDADDDGIVDQLDSDEAEIEAATEAADESAAETDEDDDDDDDEEEEDEDES